MSDTIHEVKYDVAAKLKVINLKQLSLLPEKVFSFGDYKITMSAENVRFAMLRICFLQIAGTLRDEFEMIYRNEYRDIQQVKDNTLDQVAMFINSVLEGTYDLLVSQGMEGIDFDTYVKTYYASHFNFYSYYKDAALDKDGFGRQYDADVTRLKIVGGLYRNVYKVIYAYCGAINDIFGIKAQDTSNECKAKAEKLFKELLQMDKGKEKCIAEILNNDPYKKEAYEYAILNGLDVNCELGEIAKLASIDITDTVMMYIKRFYGTLDKSDRVALASARALFQGTLNKYHIPLTDCHVLSQINMLIDSLTNSESDCLDRYYKAVEEPFILFAEKLHRINDGFHKGIYYVGEGRDGTRALKEYVTTVLNIPDICNNVPFVAWRERDSSQMSFFFTEKEVCFAHPMNGYNVIDSEPIRVPLSDVKEFGAKHRPKKQSQLVAILNNGENVEPGFEFDKIDTSYYLGVFQFCSTIARELSSYLYSTSETEDAQDEAYQIETLSSDKSALTFSRPRPAALEPDTKTSGIELSKDLAAEAEQKKSVPVQEEAPLVQAPVTEGLIAESTAAEPPVEEAVLDEVADLAALVNHTARTDESDSETTDKETSVEGTGKGALDAEAESTDTRKRRKKLLKKEESKEEKETKEIKGTKERRSKRKSSKETAPQENADKDNKVQEAAAGADKESVAEPVSKTDTVSKPASVSEEAAEPVNITGSAAESAPAEISYAQLARVEELCLDFAEKNKNTFEVTPKLLRTFKLTESDKVYTGYDSSILANGKSGFVITDKGIYCKMPLKKTLFVSWSDYSRCADVRFKNDFEGVIFVGELPVAYIMTMSNGPEKNSLYELFVILLNTLRSPAETK